MSLSSDGAPMLTMPVAPTNSGGNGGFGWDGNGSWFIIILFLFAFLGWGNNGWGNNGGNSGGVVDRFDKGAAKAFKASANRCRIDNRA